MTLSENNQHHLALLQDIYEVSSLCSTKTYIWAGLVHDVMAGEFLGEHGGVDGFTANLWNLRDSMAALFKQRGYAVSFLDEVKFLRIERDGVHALFNSVEFDGEVAMWRHAGDAGTVYFPRQWLTDVPMDFYNTKVYVSGVEFEYAIKTHPQLLNPQWLGREKDVATLFRLRQVMVGKKITPEEILKQIWSYTPYWVKKGYKEYAMPVVAWKLEPRV